MANKWQRHLKKVAKANKGLEVGKLQKLASKSYKPKGQPKAVKRRKVLPDGRKLRCYYA